MSSLYPTNIALSEALAQTRADGYYIVHLPTGLRVQELSEYCGHQDMIVNIYSGRGFRRWVITVMENNPEYRATQIKRLNKEIFKHDNNKFILTNYELVRIST